MSSREEDLAVQRTLEVLRARLEQMGEEQRQLRERLEASAQRMERLLANILQAELARLREAVAAVSDALQKVEGGRTTGPANDWSESLRATAAAAREAVERLQVLDATQAASLQTLSEEVRALREELLRPRGEAQPWAATPPEAVSTVGASPASTATAGAVAPLVEIVRMHMELLRLLVERNALRPAGETPASEGTPERTTSSSAAAEGEPESVARLRTELRSVAAAVEHQWSDLKDQHERRMGALERRLEETRHLVEHVAAQEPGRRLLATVGVGLAFIAAAALVALLWHRFQGGSVVSAGGRAATTAVGRGDTRAEADYGELVREADLAVARKDWSRAERLLQQAVRLRPDAPEARMALAALQARQGPQLGTEEPKPSAGTVTTCTIRDGRLCCTVAPGAEQCVAWSTAAPLPLSSPTSTPRARQRSQRNPPAETGSAPPPEPDEDF